MKHCHDYASRRRYGWSIWNLLTVAFVLSLLQVDSTQAQITEKNIVTEAKFSTTDYYLILDAFTKGMKMAEKY